MSPMALRQINPGRDVYRRIYRRMNLSNRLYWAYYKLTPYINYVQYWALGDEQTRVYWVKGIRHLT